VRHHVYLKLRKRLLELIAYAKVDKVTSNFNQVKTMYTEFMKKPKLAEKLEKLKNTKHRTSLFPSNVDMRILGEANTLSHKFKVYFVTDDQDYIDFKDEIKNELNVTVVEVLSLPHFAKTFKL